MNKHWRLYCRAGNEDIANNRYNDCKEKYPHHEVKITKEAEVKQA